MDSDPLYRVSVQQCESALPSSSPSLNPLVAFPLPRALESVASSTSTVTHVARDPEPAADEDDGAYEFRLFSSSARADKSALIAPKIVIRSPSPASTNPGFVVPQRPKQYYFAGHEQRSEFQSVAVTGEDVIAQSNIRWPGCFVPWRVISLKSPLHVVKSSLQATRLPNNTLNLNTTTKRPKCRASKKRRIAIRQKRALNAERSRSRALQEAAEREKLTRKNREKKVKKKARDKAKKSSANLGGGVADGTGGVHT